MWKNKNKYIYKYKFIFHFKQQTATRMKAVKYKQIEQQFLNAASLKKNLIYFLSINFTGIMELISTINSHHLFFRKQ